MSGLPFATGRSDRFVDAYSSATGKKTRVPAAWLDHPTLSKGIRKTPLSKKAVENAAATPQPDPAPAAGDNTEKEK